MDFYSEVEAVVITLLSGEQLAGVVNMNSNRGYLLQQHLLL